MIHKRFERVLLLLTSVVRPYSFIITNGKGIKDRRDVDVAQHTATPSAATIKQDYINIYFQVCNSNSNMEIYDFPVKTVTLAYVEGVPHKKANLKNAAEKNVLFK